MDALEKRTMDKVTWRLVPFLIVCYFIAYLDRVNVGFANASMSKDLSLSAAAFGGAAGIFFIAYFFFEVPSNLALWGEFARSSRAFTYISVDDFRIVADCGDHIVALLLAFDQSA